MLDTVDMARLIMHRYHLIRLHLKLEPLVLMPESSGVVGALDADSVELNGCVQLRRIRAGLDSPALSWVIPNLF